MNIASKQLARIVSVLGFAFSGSVFALGQITILNNDGAGEGFNDATIVTALPNNPGTTLGQQRLNVFNQAAAQWASRLAIAGKPDIVIRAQFDPQTCSGTSAVLGSAGAIAINRDFPGAVFSNTWYSVAEANTLDTTNTDGNGATPEINATFNISIDGPPNVCLNGTTGWWYGLDDTVAIPAGKIALMPVVFHEIGHGLGFQTYTNTATGAFNGGIRDIWSHFMADANLPNVVAGTPYTLWKDMATDADRTASAIDDPNLIWTGTSVTQTASGYLNPAAVVKVNSPPIIAGNKAAQTATFGQAVPLAGLTRDVVLGVDATAPINDGCETLTNAAAVAGKIVLVDRGLCGFAVKAALAQAAGAAGILIANNAATGLPPMGGTDPSVTIPALGISQAAGTDIKNNLLLGVVNVTMGYDLTSPAGGNSGFLRLHAPNPRVAGSSVSHFTTDAAPNLLMEPALNQELFSKTDLTVPLFRDIHWPINAAGLINLAPTITTASTYTAATNVAMPINAVVVSDPDAGVSAIQVDFTVDVGTLSATSSGGVTVTVLTPSSLRLNGARSALLTYMAAGNVTFTRATTGASNLTLSVNDLGNSGSGGALSANTAAVINVADVANQAPSISAPASLSGLVNVPLALSGFNLADVDAGTSNVTLTLTVTAGTLSATAGGGVAVSGSGTTSVILTGTVSSIQSFVNGGAVSFSLGANQTGSATLNSVINDQGNTGTGGALTASANTAITIVGDNVFANGFE